MIHYYINDFIKSNAATLAILLWLMILPKDGLTNSEVSVTDSVNTEPKNILVVGDSISAAYGMNIKDGWVALLSSQLQNSADPALNQYTFVNASISGDTTGSGANRIESLLKKHQPKIVLIALGGNDGLRGLPLKTIKNNLETMISLSLDYQADVLLAQMKIPPNYGIKYTQAFTATYDQLALEKQVNLLPFLLENVATDSNLMQQDGIHPNAQAQGIIVDHVWQTLKTLLEQ